MTLSFPGPEDAPDLARRRAVAFGRDLDEEVVEEYRGEAAAGRVAARRVDGRIVAQCRLLPSAHWFGGRTVPTLDVAGFAVAPEDRGAGHARGLIGDLVRYGADHGYGLSLLYPATTRMYRSSGWELAGALNRAEVDARTVPTDGPVLRPATTDADRAAIRACYDRSCRHRNGPAERPDGHWAKLMETAWHYVLDAPDRPGEVDAYVLVDHTPLQDDWRHRLTIVDWAATTPAGLRGVMAHVGREGTMGAKARYRATLHDVWALRLPEQTSDRVSGLFWMARGLDLAAAVAARGFPRTVRARVVVRVTDPLVPRFAEPHVLEVADGGAGLEPCRGPADVTLDPRAVGPLFTGFHDPWTLATAGLLEGTTDALEQLGAVFAGPTPTMIDFF